MKRFPWGKFGALLLGEEETYSGDFGESRGVGARERGSSFCKQRPAELCSAWTGEAPVPTWASLRFIAALKRCATQKL